MSRPIKTSSASNKLGFFGQSPVSKTSVADPAAMTCTYLGTYFTAEFVTASTNAATVIELLVDDVIALRAKLLEVTNALQAIGLV